MWNNLRARHYSVIILLAIVALETSAIAIDSFLNRESDVAFALESPYQNNHFIKSFKIAEESCPKAPITLAKTAPSTQAVKKVSFVESAPEIKKLTQTVEAEFVAAATDKVSNKNFLEYSVKKGDSLTNIAAIFGSETKEIKRVNKLVDVDTIKVGQTIKVPMPSSEMVYQVKRGDSLSRIASRFRVPLKKLIDSNNLKSHVLVQDQKIIIPIKVKNTKLAIASSKKESLTTKKLETIKPQKMALIATPQKMQLVKLNKLQIAKAPAIKPDIKFLEKELLKTPPTVAAKKVETKVETAKVEIKSADKKVENQKVSKTTNSEFKNYEVTRGDSLIKIARKFDTTVAQIKADNDITGAFIRRGQSLKIKPGKKLYRVLSKKNKPVKTASVKIVKHKVQKGECLSVIARRYCTTISAIVSENNLKSTIVKYGQLLNVPSNKKQYKVTRKSSITKSASWLRPLRGRISDRYGWRHHPVHKKRLFHAGLDIAAPRGTPIAAAASGKVIYSGYRSGYGRMVIVRHSNGYSTRYAHCSRLLVKKGQKVRAGQILAKVGATGVATGNHLHFEIRKNGKTIDPLKLISMK